MDVAEDDLLDRHLGALSPGAHDLRDAGLNPSRAVRWRPRGRRRMPLSRESLDPGADAVSSTEGNTNRRTIASAWSTRRGRRTWHVQTLLAREPGDLAIDRSAIAAGPHREGEEP